MVVPSSVTVYAQFDHALRTWIDDLEADEEAFQDAMYDVILSSVEPDMKIARIFTAWVEERMHSAILEDDDVDKISSALNVLPTPCSMTSRPVLCECTCRVWSISGCICLLMNLRLSFYLLQFVNVHIPVDIPFRALLCSLLPKRPSGNTCACWHLCQGHAP